MAVVALVDFAPPPESKTHSVERCHSEALALTVRVPPGKRSPMVSASLMSCTLCIDKGLRLSSLQSSLLLKRNKKALAI